MEKKIHIKRVWLSFFVICFCVVCLLLSRNDLVLSEGSDMGVLIYRHSLWVQIIILFFCFLSFLWIAVRHEVSFFGVLITCVLLLFFFSSLQAVTFSVRKNQIGLFIGPVKIKSVDWSVPEGVLLNYQQTFFKTEYWNDEGESMTVIRWPIPTRHDVQQIIDHRFTLREVER